MPLGSNIDATGGCRTAGPADVPFAPSVHRNACAQRSHAHPNWPGPGDRSCRCDQSQPVARRGGTAIAWEHPNAGCPGHAPGHRPARHRSCNPWPTRNTAVVKRPAGSDHSPVFLGIEAAAPARSALLADASGQLRQRVETGPAQPPPPRTSSCAGCSANWRGRSPARRRGPRPVRRRESE